MGTQPSREEDLFHAALEMPAPQGRADYLRQACLGDETLRKRVEALLHAADAGGDFLEPAPARMVGTPAVCATVPISEKPGDHISHYKLLERLGEGGCGVVYMADQTEPIRRRVALKIVKLGMDTKEVIARFEAERQALALMDHPNIARVLDAGATETGRPFFVMELVRGIRITDYCDQNNLSTRERLDLFTQVCHAVQHAHQKGIIHRDLKPSNILVTSADGVAVPKVIDFGIAKATTQQQLTDKTVFTAFQQFIGTPAYMSPEQAEMSALDIDTRSDIYSLGVLLYELLTGRPPFEQQELMKAGFDEMRRLIREQEPAKPSTCLSTLGAGDLTSVAKHRHAEPPKLVNLIRGDLDWIVMKCLEKDRTRRYSTADALADDLGHHLNHEPVEAAAPSAFYRTRKFVRRHRASLTTATALVLLILAGVMASVWQAMRATKAELQAGTVATFLDYLLESVRHEVALGRDTTVLRELLDKAVARVNEELKDQPKMQAGLWRPIAECYSILGDYDEAEKLMHAALATAKRLHGDEHLEVACALSDVATVLCQQKKLPDAERLFRESLAMHRKLGGPEQPCVPGVLTSLATTLSRQGKLQEAETILREALVLQEQQSKGEQPEVYSLLSSLVSVLQEQGKLTEAESLCRTGLAERKRMFGPEHFRVASWISHLAAVLQEQGKPVEAEALYREALAMRKKLLGPDNAEVVDSLRELAYVLSRQDKAAETELVLRETLATQQRLDPKMPADTWALNLLAEVLRKQAKLGEAETVFREALVARKKLLGPEHPELAQSLNDLASCLQDQRKFTEAKALFLEALVMREKVLGSGHEDTAWSKNNLAWLLATCPATELRDGRNAVNHAEKAVAATNRRIPNMLGTLAAACAEAGQFEKAVSVQKEAIALLKDEKERDDFASRLKLYEAKTPYHESD